MLIQAEPIWKKCAQLVAASPGLVMEHDEHILMKKDKARGGVAPDEYNDRARLCLVQFDTLGAEEMRI